MVLHTSVKLPGASVYPTAWRCGAMGMTVEHGAGRVKPENQQCHIKGTRALSGRLFTVSTDAHVTPVGGAA